MKAANSNGVRVAERRLITIMILLAIVLGVPPVQATPDAPETEALAKPNGDGPKYVPGEIIVKLKDGASRGRVTFQGGGQRRRDAILSRLEAKYRVNRRESTGSLTAPPQQREQLRRQILHTDEDVPTTCAALREDPDVEYAQPNYIYRTCQAPNDPDFPDQYAHQLIQMPDAWDISTGSHDVVVAILGTGIDVNHPDLKENIWTNDGEIPGNDIDDDENGYVDDVQGWNFESSNNDVIPEPDFWGVAGHETQVAGVIAAVGNNDEGVCGVNWQCSLMPLRLSIYITSAEVAEGLDYAAANGADILNMSFGSDEFGPEGDPIVKEAIDNAYAQGVLLFASAGNSDTTKANYPAAYYNVVAVASTDGEDIKTGHSSFGPWVDIAAPGTDIVTTDLAGEYIATAGTSFSSPYVAAVGALVLAHRPDLSPVEVRAILENTTDPVYYGDLDPERSYVGTGRVNAYTALQNADVAYPLAEIIAPRQAQTLEADGDENSVEVHRFTHGDAFILEYSRYGQDDWIVIDEGEVQPHPDGSVHVSVVDLDAGVYELRLSVSSGDLTHVDRKIFAIGSATDQAPWPQPETVEGFLADWYVGNSICMDVDGDGRNEIIQVSMSLGDWWFEGKVNIWNEDGNSLPNWPKSMQVLSAAGCAVGDIDGDGDYEVVAASNSDGFVYAWHVESGDLLEGWPQALGGWYTGIVGPPVLADLDSDGDAEVLIALDEESSDTDSLYALQGDGSSLWQRRYRAIGALTAADLDGDGGVEITLCGYGPGVTNVYTYILNSDGQLIKKWKNGSQKGTAVVDLDGDGESELVHCTDNSVKAVQLDGRTLWTAKLYEPFGETGALTVGDIDGDGLSEVYVNSHIEADGFAFSRVHAFDHRGRLMTAAGFPKTIMGVPANSAPLIGDVDGDGQNELLVGSARTPLMAWEQDGAVTTGFPMLTLAPEAGCTPTLADLDQDGDIEIIVAGSDSRFHVIDAAGSVEVNGQPWLMARHDAQNSGWAAETPVLAPIAAPEQIAPGERLRLELVVANEGDQPLRFSPGHLPEGAYYDPNSMAVVWKPAADQAYHTYTFSFLVTDGVHQSSRSVSVTVMPDAIYHANMDTDPNWELDEGWAWGQPTGQGSINGDPSSGYTGESVIGFVLDGDYEHDLQETRYATTGPINCEGHENVRLSFWRWLGIEAPYDYANVQASNDGENWVDLWTTGYAHISEQSWQFVEYAVPASVADGQATVYFRWGIGPTDESVAYPGWNIDDVQVTGDRIE